LLDPTLAALLSRLRPLLLTSVATLATLAFSRSATGQQHPAPPADTVSAGIPTAEASRSALSTASAAKRNDRLPQIFYGVLGAAATTTMVLHVDADSGGYHDGWTTATDFPDKAVHALAAWAITTAGVDLGARPRYAALAVCAAGTVFEVAQGYVSVYDIAADCVGAAGAAAFQSWRATRRAKSERARAERARVEQVLTSGAAP
jgi:hypothetical protein